VGELTEMAEAVRLCGSRVLMPRRFRDGKRTVTM
jgi:hypothetical protein